MYKKSIKVFFSGLPDKKGITRLTGYPITSYIRREIIGLKVLISAIYKMEIYAILRIATRYAAA